MIEEIRLHLWNADVDAASYGDTGERYQSAILEQYKLYVEMADRISARRGLANTFFLTLNTTIFTVIGVFWKDRPNASVWILLFPLVVLLPHSSACLSLVRDYRQLKAPK